MRSRHCQPTRYSGTPGATLRKRLRSTARPRYPVVHARNRAPSGILALAVASPRDFGRGISRVAPQALPNGGVVSAQHAPAFTWTLGNSLNSRRPTDGRSGPGATFDISKRPRALAHASRRVHDGMRERPAAPFGGASEARPGGIEGVLPGWIVAAQAPVPTGGRPRRASRTRSIRHWSASDAATRLVRIPALRALTSNPARPPFGHEICRFF